MLRLSTIIASCSTCILLAVILAYRFIIRVRNDDTEERRSLVAGSFRSGDLDKGFLNDEESLFHLAEEYDYGTLSPEEQRSFMRGEEFSKTNPPLHRNVRGKSFTRDDDLLIKDYGIDAFEFEQEREILTSRYFVEERTDVSFSNNDLSYSTSTAVLNYPLPTKNRTSDTIYFEVKVYEFSDDPNSHFAVGLVTKPYPSSFRLPGYNKFSFAYESTGNLKINKPFPTPLQQHRGEQSVFNAQILPPLKQSDIVGFGYVVSSGTYFITRNGRKLMDVMKGCFLDMFPAIGCFSCNAKFQTNLGQLGFVWIEANVRKYGFFSTSDRKFAGQRGLASLPQYGVPSSSKDKLLDRGEELPPHYSDVDVDFFGRGVKVGTSQTHEEPM